MKFKKKIIFSPAFDKRSNDPKKNYGIHGVGLAFYLIGEKGVVQFKAFTNWMLPHVQKEIDERTINDIKRGSDIKRRLEMNYHPNPFDIGYHSKIPMHEGQNKMEKCNFFEDGCYCDGSSVHSDKFLKILIEKGSKGVWKEMKKYYHDVFEKNDSEKTLDQIPFGQLINLIFK